MDVVDKVFVGFTSLHFMNGADEINICTRKMTLEKSTGGNLKLWTDKISKFYIERDNILCCKIFF